jgi:L-amino acid N-acyltransferase YncA
MSLQTYLNAPFGTSGEPLKLPDDLEQSLDTIFALDEDYKRKFFIACSWYAQYRHTWEESHSSGFIALVTALECLAQEKEVCLTCNQPFLDNEEDICQSCGQPRYRVQRHFEDFLKECFPAIDQFPKERKILYQVRSHLAHGADLLRVDLEPWNPMLNPKVDEQDQLQRNLYLIAGIAMYNWLHTDIHVRTVIANTTEDIKQCALIDKEMGFTTPPGIQERAKAEKRLLVAKERNRVIGYLRYGYVWDGELPYVQMLRVRPTFQRKGVGKKLIEFIEQEVKKQKMKALLSSTDDNNNNSLLFHQALGFVECGRLDVNQDGLMEIFLMKKLDPS